MTRLKHQFSRRNLLASVGSLAGAAVVSSARGQQATPMSTPAPVSLAGTTLRVLSTQHGVEAYDAAYDQLVKTWAGEQGVTVTLDWVSSQDIVAAVANEVTLGQGHDLIDAPQPLPQFELALMDLSDLTESTVATFGNALPFALATTFNPTTGKRWGLNYAYEPAVALYRRSLWSEVGFEFGPVTTQDLLTGGTRIWNDRGVQVGIGLSPTRPAEVTMQSLLWAFGGAIQDINESVTIDSTATRETADFSRALYENAATPVTLEWLPGDNTQFMSNGFGSYTVDSLTGLRRVQSQAAPEIAADIHLAPPLTNDDGTIPGQFSAMSQQIGMIPIWSTQTAGANSLLQYLVANTRTLTDASQFALLPTFPERYPELTMGGGSLTNDPFGVLPPDKLQPLQNASQWTAAPGNPGPSNALTATCAEQYTLSTLMGLIASGGMPREEAIALAQVELETIANGWREMGLMAPITDRGVG